MKKLLFISIIACAFLASCKKDRVCTCTTTGGGTAQVITYTKITKSDAKDACLATSSSSYTGQPVTTTTCTLN